MGWTTLTHLIETILSIIGGSGLASWLTYRSTVKRDNTRREDIYADHTGELWERLDKITDERDELSKTVIKLQSKVDDQSKTIREQSKVIDAFGKQVNQLSEQVKKLSGEMKR